MRIEWAIAWMVLFTSTAECQSIDPEVLTGGGVDDPDEVVETIQTESDRTDRSDSLLFNPYRPVPSKVSECMTSAQSMDWMDHEGRLGPVVGWEELFVLTSFDRETIDCLKKRLPLDEFRNKTRLSMKEMINAAVVQWTQSMSRVFIPNPSGRKMDESLGDPWRSEMRIRVTDGVNYKLGLNMEKDPGERWWSKSGPDHLGYFMELHPKNKNWKLILGDFEYKIGQGQLAGSRVFGDFLTDPGCLAARPSGNRSHSSMYEADYCKGVSLSCRGRRLDWQLGISDRMEDGTINRTEYKDETMTTFSIDRSGLHSTSYQSTRNNSNRRSSAGGELVFDHRNASIGIAALCWKDRVPDIRFINDYFENNMAAALGVNSRWNTVVGYFFGEIATGTGRQRGGRIGWISQVDKSITATLLYSFNKAGPLTPYSISNYSSGTDGSSALVALSARITKKLDIQAFLETGNSMDAMMFHLKPKERTGIRIQYRIDKKNSSSFMIRKVILDETETSVNGTPDHQDSKRVQVSWRAHLCPLFGVELEARAELSFSRKRSDESHGYLLSNDLHLDRPKWPVSIHTRFSIFQATDYSSAIRTQEYDLPYHSSRLLAYGTGQSFYIVLQPKLGDKWKCWLKWSSTTVYDRLLSDNAASAMGNRSETVSIQFTRTWLK